MVQSMAFIFSSCVMLIGAMAIMIFIQTTMPKQRLVMVGKVSRSGKFLYLDGIHIVGNFQEFAGRKVDLAVRS